MAKLRAWKSFSVLMVLMLIASLGAVVVPASPAAADGGGVPNPTFLTYDTDANGSRQDSAIWSRNGTYAHNGTDSIHFITSAQTRDYAAVATPTNFVLGTGSGQTTAINYWGYTVAADKHGAPDEIFLIFDADLDGDGKDDVLANTGTKATAGNWSQWNFSDTGWYKVDFSVTPPHSADTKDITVYYGKTVKGIVLGVGSPESSGGVNVDAYVDQLVVNGQTLLDEDTGTIEVPALIPGFPGPRIQDAINAALPGDTINVAAGTYLENININKKLVLLGAQANVDPRLSTGGRGGAESIIDGSNDMVVVNINANEVEVNGFTLKKGKRAAIEGNTTGAAIRYNKFEENGWAQNYCYTYNVRGCSNVLFQYNDVVADTTTTHTTHYGFYAYGNTDQNQVKNNDFRGPFGNAIYLKGYDYHVSNNNVISGNDISGAKCAMQLESLASTIVSNNNLHENTAGSGYGLYLWGQYAGSHENVSIIGNIISKNTKGIRIKSGTYGNLATFHINMNNITGNTEYAITNECGSLVDATNNWWGANDGPNAGVGTGHGDAVSTYVNYNPWLKLNLSAEPASIPADGTSPSTITADMTKNSDNVSAGGFVPDGTTINFVTTGGTLSKTSENTTSGIASIMLTSSTTAGTVTVTGTAPGNGDYARASTDVEFTPLAATNITLDADKYIIPADGESQSTLTATVKNSLGNPVEDGTDVLFTTSKGTVGSSSVTKPTSGGVATATLTSISSTSTVIADVTAAANGASRTTAVFFQPAGAPTPTDISTTAVTGSDTITNTPTGGNVVIDATGEHTVTTAKYDGNPAGTPTFQATGNYYDVHLDTEDGVNSMTIQFSPATASTVIYYWTGSTWARCSNQAYAGGIVTVTVTPTTQPNLTDLAGLIFASGTTPPPPPSPAPAPAPTPEPAVSGISTALPQSHGAGGLSVITPPQGPMPLPNMLVQSAAITTGKQVSAKVTNTGGASGSLRVTLYAGNNAVESKNVSLAPGDVATVSFDASSLGPGTYNIKVNNVPAGQLTVEGGSSSLFFIALVAFLVLMAALFIIYFRRRRAAGW